MFKFALKRIVERLFLFSSSLLLGASPSVAGESDEWSLRGSLDANWSRGATDLNGDYKELDLAWFRRDLAFSIRNKFYSPQNAAPVVAYDTAVALVTLGWEREFLRAYASVGYQNGGLIGAGHALLSAGHHAAGFRSLRRSPPSTSGKALALAEVVAERPFELFRAGDARFGVAPQGWLAIGNARQSVGAGVFGVASWRTPLENVRNNPGHFAQTRNVGSFVYAGLTAAHVFHDDVYRGLMVRAVLPSAVVGVRARLGAFTLGAQYEKMLSPEARGTRDRAADRLSVSLGRRI